MGYLTSPFWFLSFDLYVHETVSLTDVFKQGSLCSSHLIVEHIISFAFIFPVGFDGGNLYL